MGEFKGWLQVCQETLPESEYNDILRTRKEYLGRNPSIKQRQTPDTFSSPLRRKQGSIRVMSGSVQIN